LRCRRHRPPDNDAINPMTTVFSSCESIRGHIRHFFLCGVPQRAGRGPHSSAGMILKVLGGRYDARRRIGLPPPALNLALDLIVIVFRPVRRTKIPAAS
jgi:hypothetical protein